MFCARRLCPPGPRPRPALTSRMGWWFGNAARSGAVEPDGSNPAQRDKIMVTIKVNGTSHRLDVESETPLLWVLREEVGLTGTKYGCGIAQCGACTVHVNGQAIRSCSVPIGSLDGAEI